MHTRGKLVLLGSLYLSQGLPFGFLTQAVPVLLRAEGATLTTIGDTSLLMAPWLLKFLWAPAVDRLGSGRLGRRRSWILPLQALTVLVVGALAFANPKDALPTLLVATFITAILASTQDIATDGLAVSLLGPTERGIGNGVQVAGYRLGMVLGGGALLVVFARIGWAASFLGMAALLVLATIPIALWREPPSDDPPPVGESAARLVRDPEVRRWLVLLVLYKLGEQMGGAVTKPMLVDLKLDLEQIGWLGAADSGASLVGALVGGLATGYLGRRPMLVAFGALQAVGVLGWALPALGYVALWQIAGVKVVDGFLGSLATAALFTAMMDACRPSAGGTDYTVQASVVLVATFAGSALGGRIADACITGLGSASAGYTAHYALAAGLTLLGALAMGVSRGPPDGWIGPAAISPAGTGSPRT